MDSISILYVALTPIHRSLHHCNSSHPCFFQINHISRKTDSLKPLRFRTLAIATARSSSFSWNDALQIGQEDFGDDDLPGIQSYINRVQVCSRRSNPGPYDPASFEPGIQAHPNGYASSWFHDLEFWSMIPATPLGITCKENLLKECEEEAGISGAISNFAIPVGAVSYVDIDGYRYERDVLFCFGLQLLDGFVPNNQG